MSPFYYYEFLRKSQRLLSFGLVADRGGTQDCDGPTSINSSISSRAGISQVKPIHHQHSIVTDLCMTVLREQEVVELSRLIRVLGIFSVKIFFLLH